MNESKHLNVGALLQERQSTLGITDEALATAVGYKPAVIAMIKAGTMRLPVNKVSAFALALQINTVTLLGALLQETSPDLWSAIQPLLPLGELAPAEVNLLRHLRKLTKGTACAPIVLDGSAIVAVVASA